MGEKQNQITLEDLDRLTIGENSNKLYWDKHPVKTENKIKLTLWQNIVGGIVALATFAATATTTISNFENNCLLGYGQQCPVDIPLQNDTQVDRPLQCKG